MYLFTYVPLHVCTYARKYTQVHVYVCKRAFAYVRPSIPPSVCVSVRLYVCPPTPACCGTSWGGAWVTKLALSHCLAGRGHGPWHPPQLWRVPSCSKLKLKSTVTGSSSLVWCDIYAEDTQRPCMAQKACLSQPSARFANASSIIAADAVQPRLCRRGFVYGPAKRKRCPTCLLGP